jgi:hypothetical protein
MMEKTRTENRKQKTEKIEHLVCYPGPIEYAGWCAIDD